MIAYRPLPDTSASSLWHVYNGCLRYIELERVGSRAYAALHVTRLTAIQDDKPAPLIQSEAILRHSEELLSTEESSLLLIKVAMYISCGFALRLLLRPGT